MYLVKVIKQHCQKPPHNAPINDIPPTPSPSWGQLRHIDRVFVSQFLPQPWGGPG